MPYKNKADRLAAKRRWYARQKEVKSSFYKRLVAKGYAWRKKNRERKLRNDRIYEATQRVRTPEYRENHNWYRKSQKLAQRLREVQI